MARGILLRDLQGRQRNVYPQCSCARTFVKDRDRDASRACSDITEKKLICRWQEIESDLHQQFRFGPRNKNIAVNFKIQIEKRLMPGDVLQRLATGAPFHELLKLLDGSGRKYVSGMGNDETVIARQSMRQQRTGFAALLRHAGF